jgi:hypothetical protein
MSKIILTEGKEKKEFKSYEEMFQDISSRGFIILNVEDGKIITKDKKEFTIEVVTTIGTAEAFLKEMIKYREEQRKTIVPLMKQGIVTKEQAAKMGEQFKFIDKK